MSSFLLGNFIIKPNQLLDVLTHAKQEGKYIELVTNWILGNLIIDDSIIKKALFFRFITWNFLILLRNP